MSVRFAAAGNGECAIVAKYLTMPVLGPVANDCEPNMGRDTMLREALRHFAAHGLSAAQRAHEFAEQAYFAGQRDDYQHWMAICRSLDRRMADRSLARCEAVG
ncbi:MAG: hypothetical protein RLY97_633 [Pseudomonadota bacterium]|jgi:hypothetical protein